MIAKRPAPLGPPVVGLLPSATWPHLEQPGTRLGRRVTGDTALCPAGQQRRRERRGDRQRDRTPRRDGRPQSVLAEFRVRRREGRAGRDRPRGRRWLREGLLRARARDSSHGSAGPLTRGVSNSSDGQLRRQYDARRLPRPRAAPAPVRSFLLPAPQQWNWHRGAGNWRLEPVTREQHAGGMEAEKGSSSGWPCGALATQKRTHPIEVEDGGQELRATLLDTVSCDVLDEGPRHVKTPVQGHLLGGPGEGRWVVRFHRSSFLR
jgi:hypothetical protein